MSVTEQELQARYAELSDARLLELWQQNTLIDLAQAVLQNELLRRGITPPPLAKPIDPDDVVVQVDPWVTVARLTTAPEAHILRARLEADDIPAVVADEHMVTADWLYSNLIGGVRVQVPQSRVADAEATITALHAGDYALDAHEVDSVGCPQCGSQDVSRNRRSWKVSFLFLFLFQLPLPYTANAFKCQRCGHSWKQPD